MVILFVFVMIALTALACLCVVPWLGSWRVSLLACLWLSISSYGLYGYWGSMSIVKTYYSDSAYALRETHKALRLRLMHLSKAEYALRLRLERVPDAPRLLWQLEELLGQRAMLAGAWREAYAHGQAALLALAKDPVQDPLHAQCQATITQRMMILKPLIEARLSP